MDKLTRKEGKHKIKLATNLTHVELIGNETTLIENLSL